MRYGQKRLQISKNIPLMKLELLITKFSWSFLKKQTIPDKTQWMGGKCVFIVAWESSSLLSYVNTLQSMMLFLRKSEMNIKFEICWRNVSGLLIFRLYKKIVAYHFQFFFIFSPVEDGWWSPAKIFAQVNCSILGTQPSVNDKLNFCMINKQNLQLSFQMVFQMLGCI